MLQHLLVLLGSYAASFWGVTLFLQWLSWDLRRPSLLVGLPLFSDSDIVRFATDQYLILLLPPLLSWILYVGIQHWLPLPSLRAARIERTRSVEHGDERLFVVGLGFAAYLIPMGPVACFVYPALIATAYTLAVSWLAGKRTVDLSQRPAERARLNLFCLPFLIPILSFWSARTGAIVDGVEVSLTWFPAVLGLGLALFAAGAIRAYLPKYAGSIGALLEFEKRVLLVVLVPLALICLRVNVPHAPALFGTDFFHFGEWIVPASLLQSGLLPWRDFLFVHGLLEDVLQSYVGMASWGKTIWASLVGYELWLRPASLAFLGLLFQRLFRERMPFLLCALLLLLVPPLYLPVFRERFALMPLCLWVFVAYLDRPSWARAFVLALLSVVHLFLTPEFLFLALGLAAMTAVSDWQSRSYYKTLRFGLCSVFLIGAVFLSFHFLGLLAPFFAFYLGTAQDHLFSGGSIPSVVYTREFVLFLATMNLTFWYALNSWWRGKHFTNEELAMGAVAFFSVLYFQKYTSRADAPHFAMVWSVALILFFYGLYRLLAVADDAVSARLRPWKNWSAPLTSCLLIGLFLDLRPKLFNIYTGQAAGARLTASVSSLPGGAEKGPLVLGERNAKVISGLEGFFRQHPAPEGVFDFTNQPLLFHALLNLKPAISFPYTSLAIHPALQTRLVSELEKTKPRFVIYQSIFSPLGIWDGIPNRIRHYHVSRYLLSHYEPYAWVSGNLILVRLGDTRTRGWTLPLDPSLSDCDWGWVLDRWKQPVTGLSGDKLGNVLTVPESIKNKAPTLELVFSKVGEGGVVVRSERGALLASFRTHAGEGFRYRVPLGSCPAWYTHPTSVSLEMGENSKVEKVRWIETPIFAHER